MVLIDTCVSFRSAYIFPYNFLFMKYVEAPGQLPSLPSPKSGPASLNITIPSKGRLLIRNRTKVCVLL